MWWLVVTGWLGVAAALVPVDQATVRAEVVGPHVQLTLEQHWVLPDAVDGSLVVVVPVPEGAVLSGVVLDHGPAHVVSRVADPDRARQHYQDGLQAGRVAGFGIALEPDHLELRLEAPVPGERLTVRTRFGLTARSEAGERVLALPVDRLGRLLEVDEVARWATICADSVAGPDGEVLVAGVDLTLVGPTVQDRVRVDGADLHTMVDGPGRYRIQGAVSAREPVMLRWGAEPQEPVVGAVLQGEKLLVWLEAPESVPRRRVVGRELLLAVDPQTLVDANHREIVRRALLDWVVRLDRRDRIAVSGPGVSPGLTRTRPASAAVVSELKQWLRDLDPGAPVAGPSTPTDAPAQTRVLVTAGVGRVWTELGSMRRDDRLEVFAPVAGALDPLALPDSVRLTAVQPGEDPRAAVRRFVKRVSKPVLTQVRVFGYDLPDLTLHGPVSVLLPMSERSTVVVQGRAADGPWRREIAPLVVEGGAALPVGFGIDRVMEERRGRDREEQLRRLGIAWQIPTRSAALVLVREDVDDAGEPVETWAVGTELRLAALGQAIQTAQLERLAQGRGDMVIQMASGRSYQSAVKVAAGATNGRSNFGGGAQNENTYLLDGANITDPVTGTFSQNFNLAAVDSVRVQSVGFLPRYQGASGDVVDVSLATGGNALELAAGVQHERAVQQASGATTVESSASGPVVRDRLFSVSTTSWTEAWAPERAVQSGGASQTLAFQPSSEHRFKAFGTVSPTTLRTAGATLEGLGLMGQGTWDGFPSSDVHLRATATATEARIDGDRRARQQGLLRGSWLDARLAGRHDLEAGVDLERIRWEPAGVLAAAWPADPVPVQAARLGLYAQDEYKPRPWLELAGGLRSDIAYGAPHLAPRVHAQLQHEDREHHLRLGAGRSWSPLHVTDQLRQEGPAPTLRDEGLVQGQVQLASDAVVRLTATHQAHSDLLGLDGSPQALGLLALTATLDGELTWELGGFVAWTRRWLTRTPTQSLYAVGALGRFRDSVRAQGSYTPGSLGNTAFEGQLTVDAAPLLPGVPDPATLQVPIPARVLAEGGVRSTVSLRKGRLGVGARYGYLHFLESVQAPPLTLVTDPMPELPGWEGHRVSLTLDLTR